MQNIHCANYLLIGAFAPSEIRHILEAFYTYGWSKIAYTGNLSVSRALFDRAGGFADAFHGWGFEDVDLGWRLWASGRDVVACPEAVARHRGSATSSRWSGGKGSG